MAALQPQSNHLRHCLAILLQSFCPHKLRILLTLNEVFADRAYQADGSLVPRKLPGAVIHDKDEAIARTVRMVTEGKVTAITGEEVEIAAHSICVHGDNPSAVEFVKNIRTQLTARGVEIAPIREIV